MSQKCAKNIIVQVKGGKTVFRAKAKVLPKSKRHRLHRSAYNAKEKKSGLNLFTATNKNQVIRKKIKAK